MEDTTHKVDGEKRINPKRRLVIKILRICMYIVLGIIGLNTLLYILLSIPSIQQAVANFAIKKLEATLRTSISIEEIRLGLFDHAQIKGLYVEDLSKDTLLHANYLGANINLLNLIKYDKLDITSVSLKDFVIKVNKKDSLSDMNFQFIIDAFAGDTVKEDTTKSKLTINICDIDIKNGRLYYDVLSDSVMPEHLFDASHISFYDFKANVDINLIKEDSMGISLNRLSAKEKSGLEIKKLSGDYLATGDQLEVANLKLLLPNSHLITEEVKYNLKNRKFSISTQDTEIAGEDFIAFLPNLKFLKNKLNLNTKISGQLPLVKLESLFINYGNETLIEGYGHLASYEDIINSNFKIDINNFKITSEAISDFVHLADSTFITPTIVNNLGNLSLKAKADGKICSFGITADMETKQGLLSLQGKVKADETFSNLDLEADLKTINYNLAYLFGKESQLGNLTTHINLIAHQSEQRGLDAKVKGVVDALQINKDTLRNVNINAMYNAQLISAELQTTSIKGNGSIEAKASMTQEKIPEIKVDIDIHNFNVDRIFPNENWVNPRLTFCLNGNIKSLNIDEMTASINLDSLNFEGDNFHFAPGNIQLNLTQLDKDIKDISLNSSLANVNIHGKYKFIYLTDEFSNLMNKYLPNAFEKRNYNRSNKNDFTFKIDINNTESYSTIFDIPIDIIEPAKISGRINTMEDQLLLEANIPLLRYDSILNINKMNIHASNKDSIFDVNIETNLYLFALGSQFGLNLNSIANGDRLVNTIKIATQEGNVKANGNIEVLTTFSYNKEKQLVSILDFVPTAINLNNLKLGLKAARIKNEGDRTDINNFGINLNDKDFFGAEGVISKNPTDKLNVYFSEAQIGDLLKELDIDYIDATLNGNVEITNLMVKPEFHIDDFLIQDIIMRNDTLGTINIASEWVENDKYFEFNTLWQKDLGLIAQLDGKYNIAKNTIDAHLYIKGVDMKIIEPYTVGIINQLGGQFNSDLTIKGDLDKPEVSGYFGFNEASIGIEYTNVKYIISDTIQIAPDRVGFRNLTIKDANGNKAIVNANVTHKDYKDIKMTIDANLSQFMVLNTQSRTDSLFYGKIFASGQVNIKGDKDKINMNMKIKNDKNSNLNILIPQTSEADDYKSVVYINTPKYTTNIEGEDINILLPERANDIPIYLGVSLTVNQDLLLGVVIDPSTGDAMEVRGNGDINFSYDMEKNIMNAFGKYALTEGKVELNLRNIKKLNFEIRSGSSLSFIGDPLKTTFDIVAYRRVRADLKSLDKSFEADGSSTRTLVDAELGINGDINKMNLSYDISLPNASDDFKRKVSSLVNTDEEKIKQFAYLITAGTFHSNSGGSNTNFSNAMWTSLASSAVSNGLNSALGNVLGNKWQIGTNLESTDGSLENLDMSVSLSTKFMNDKLRLNTSLGYRTDQTSVDNESFIGDFEAEYDLTAAWMLRAYNKTNDQFYKPTPFTQGVGISYTKESNTLKRLFRFFAKNRTPRTRPPRTQTDSVRVATDSIKPLQESNIPVKKE